MTKQYIKPKFFTCISIKSNNDGTSGFRFNILGIKGLVRRRKNKSNGLRMTNGKCFKSYICLKLQSILKRRRQLIH